MAADQSHDSHPGGDGSPHGGGRLQRQVDRLEGIVRSLVDGLEKYSADLARNTARMDKYQEQVEHRLDKERDARKLPIGAIAGWVAVLFTMLTTGFMAWTRPVEIAAAAAREGLAADIRHQADLDRVRTDCNADVTAAVKDSRERDIRRFDGQIVALQQTSIDRVAVLQSLRDDVDANRAILDERTARLEDADRKHIDLIQAGTGFTTAGLAGLRSELQAVRDDVNAMEVDRWTSSNQREYERATESRLIEYQRTVTAQIEDIRRAKLPLESQP